MKSKPMTAKELRVQLERDSEYQERILKRNEQLEPIWDKRAEDEKHLVEEIRQCGFEIESVYDLVNNSPHPVLERNFIGPYNEAFPVLVKHLEVGHERIIREGIIRALTVKDGGMLVEEALLKQFYIEKDSNSKWVLANALRLAMPYHRRKKHPEVKALLKYGTKK